MNNAVKPKVKLLHFSDPDTGELMDTFIFPETANLEQIAMDIQAIWEREDGSRSYEEIIIDRYGDEIIHIADKKVMLW